MTESSNNDSGHIQRLDDPTSEGFHALLGHRLVEWDHDVAVIELELRAEHLNRAGVVHGGVLSTLVDAACGFAGCYNPDPAQQRGAITLSLTVSFTAQVSSGRLRAVARRRAGGRRVYFAQCDVYGPEGQLVAMGEGSFRLRSGSRPAQGEA